MKAGGAAPRAWLACMLFGIRECTLKATLLTVQPILRWRNAPKGEAKTGLSYELPLRQALQHDGEVAV